MSLARLEVLVEAAQTAAKVAREAYELFPTEPGSRSRDWSKMLARELERVVKQMRTPAGGYVRYYHYHAGEIEPMPYDEGGKDAQPTDRLGQTGKPSQEQGEERGAGTASCLSVGSAHVAWPERGP